MALYPQLIMDALKHVRYPGMTQDIVSAEMVEDDTIFNFNVPQKSGSKTIYMYGTYNQ